MKNVILILIVMFFVGCSKSDPVNGDASGNFIGNYEYAIASPLGFVSKYSWIVERRSANVIDLDMTKVIVRSDGSQTKSRDLVTEVEITDAKKLDFSYINMNGRFVQVSVLAAPEKLTVSSVALQGDDATHLKWYEFDKR
ncbi:hypothetical protein LZD49_08510 [Dyadobacter sp. CY261]|uniref:hypothetical protein n=1 Tax=Dyadobacter sp. CY261 TaxID=2907203 RepID=UPI001F48BBC1|nr:hypothetical protein [Dyadobacter sp. CY261]MCF0070512.1 hypothetical protein [Dyadobacter sp. CY261]